MFTTLFEGAGLASKDQLSREEALTLVGDLPECEVVKFLTNWDFETWKWSVPNSRKEDDIYQEWLDDREAVRLALVERTQR